jgi:hypothetical protein
LREREREGEREESEEDGADGRGKKAQRWEISFK